MPQLNYLKYRVVPAKRILTAVCILSLTVTVGWVLVITGGGGALTGCSTSCSRSDGADTQAPELVSVEDSTMPEKTPFAQGFRLPRLVHFTSRSEMLRTEYLPFMQRWLARNPHLDFYLWRDQDATCLARLRYPRWLGALNGSGQLLQTPLERSDLTRILALHALGGLYLDLDTAPVANLTHLFDNPIAGAMFATEPQEHASLVFSIEYLLSNAAMFSLPGHKFLTEYIRTIEIIARKERFRTRNNYDAPGITGPIVMLQVYEQYLADSKYETCSSPECRVHLFSPEVFCPLFDPVQIPWMKVVCNVSTINTLPDTKRHVCEKLWAQNFTQSPLTNATLAIHMFSHISSVKASATPTYFNAQEVFPRIKFFSNTVTGC